MQHAGSTASIPQLSEQASLTQNSISLVDHTSTPQTASAAPSIAEPSQDAERNDSEALLAPPTPSSEPLIKKLTSSSLQDTVRQQISKQKYARYQSHRYEQHEGTGSSKPQEGEEADAAQKNYLERSRAKALNLLKRKKTFGKASEKDAALDILYENQRGAFLFGVPIFSSRSLLNLDPEPWQNAAFRTSAVDIRNAQVPDPSWEWVWKSWYVDMSRDVDEEGWEYSFSFQPHYSWHGNHPWLYSFVRRRRWLRKRVRKDALRKTRDKSHELAPDYFTIHTAVLSAGSRSASRTRTNPSDSWHASAEEAIHELDITDIALLIALLRKARIDREKLFAVRKFVNSGGDDLYYLAERMPEIMSLFIYQSSRRQLLADLLHHHSGATERRESLAGHGQDGDDEAAKKLHDAASRQAGNLLKAVRAADDEVKSLEYWSDIRDMAQHGETLFNDASGDWDSKRWQGLSTPEPGAFKSKQQADDPAAELHEQAKARSKHTKESSNETDTSGYTTAPSVAPSGKPSLLSRTSTLKHKDDDADADIERYVTASEGPSDSDQKRRRGKGKGKLKPLNLDGVQEENSEGAKEDNQDVEKEVVAPIPIDADYGQIEDR